MHDDERTNGGCFTTLLVGAVCLLLSLGGGVGFFMFRQQQLELADVRRELAVQQELLAASRDQPAAAADLKELLELVPAEPLSPAPATDPPRVVEIVISSDGKLTVNGEKLTTDELRTLLVVDRLEHAVAVKIRVHEKTPLPKYLAVVNACSEAGVSNTSTVTELDAP